MSWTSVAFGIVNGGFNTPAITLPNAYTVWHVNDTVQIEWDVRQVKSENGTLPSIDLYNSTSRLPVATLAQNFQSNTGSISVTVPNVVNGTYRVISKSRSHTSCWYRS